MNITRRDFFSGLIVAGASIGDANRLLAETDATVLLKNTTPEEWYSADDGGDWLPALERAQKHARTINLSKKTYEISRAIVCSSDRTWIGSGPETVIKNTRSAHPVMRGVFFAGNMHPAALDSGQKAGCLPAFSIRDVQVGEKSCILETTAEAANFFVGQNVFFRSREVVQTGNSGFPPFPVVGQFNVIDKVDGDTLTFKYPIITAISAPSVSPIGRTPDLFLSSIGMPLPWYLVERVTVSDMTIDADFVCSTRTGMIDCHFSDLVTVNAVSPFAVNAIVKSTFKRITAPECTQRAVEVKCFSDSSTFENVTASIKGDNGNFGIVIDVGENSQNITLRNMDITLLPDATGKNFLYQVSGRGNILEDFDFDIKSEVRNYVPMFLSPSITGAAATGCVVRRGKVSGLKFGARHMQIGASPHDKYTVSDYTIESVRFEGGGSGHESIRVNTVGLGSIRNCSFPYPIAVTKGALAPQELGNSLLPTPQQ